MEIIWHRASRISDWSTAKEYGWGIEVDLRTHNGRVYISHDPIEKEESLEFLPSFAMLYDFTTENRFRTYANKWSNTVVLDCKESGIIERTHDIWRYGYYAFTGLSVPDEIYAISCGYRTLTRTSRFENLDLCVDCMPQYQNVSSNEYWVDYVFHPSDLEKYEEIASRSFVVSPELHKNQKRAGHWAVQRNQHEKACELTDEFIQAVYDMGFKGVCTDEPMRYANSA